jgi:hydroxymethylpyrimidine/phosphomethylpyrimidine kinase
MTATTALTAQNTLGVQDVHITPPSFVEKQIRAVMEDGFLEGQMGVVKIGTSLYIIAYDCCEEEAGSAGMVLRNIHRHVGFDGDHLCGDEGSW